MTDRAKEALSAIMDGEAGELETRRLLEEIARNDDLREIWDRYHLARSAMAGDALDATDGADAIRRLWDAVDAGAYVESADTVEATETVRRRQPFGLRTGAAALGVAASFVMAVWLYPIADPGGGSLTADRVAHSGTQPASLQGTQPLATPASLSEHATWETLTAEERARAQAYILQHHQRQSMANRAHPIPHAKLASYRPQPQPDRNE